VRFTQAHYAAFAVAFDDVVEGFVQHSFLGVGHVLV
jgi:hypothetical protein